MANRTMQIVLCVLLAAALAGGCGPRREKPDVARALRLERRAESLRDQTTRLQARVTELEEQVRTLQGLGDKRLDVLVHPERMSVGGRTAGFDVDGEPGDDGVRVFVSPIDAQGTTVKVAGDVRIELYDLAAAPDQQFLGACGYPAGEVGRYWLSAPFINRFVFECRWGPRPPAHPEVTVRVTFVDYLTGRTFTGQVVAVVTPPPAGGPSQQGENGQGQRSGTESVYEKP